MSSEDKTQETPVEEKPAVLRAMPAAPAAPDAYDVPVAPAASAEEAAAAREQRLREADEIFAAAQRLAADCDYAAAADLLSTVLETRCDVYGPLAVECREAYILYGKCLLLSVKSTHGLDAVLAQSNKIAAARQRAADADGNEAAGAAAAAAAPVAEVDDDESGITDTLENAWECLEVARVVCSFSFFLLYPCIAVCVHCTHCCGVPQTDLAEARAQLGRALGRAHGHRRRQPREQSVPSFSISTPFLHVALTFACLSRQRKAGAGGLHQVPADPQEPAAQQRPPHRRGVCPLP